MKKFEYDLLASLPTEAQELCQSMRDRKSVVGIVGLGYVGMPIALEFAKKGFSCVGLDVSKSKIEALNRGENFIEDLDDDEVRDMVDSGRLRATLDPGELAEADIIYIAVPTPFNANKDPDLRFVLEATRNLTSVVRPGQVFILKSTTFPGTTEEYVQPILEKSGLQAGRDFYVAFSPERVDPGNKTWHTGNTPIVTGGIDEVSTLVAACANHQIIDNVYLVSSPKVAELEKLLENIFRSVNIALVNELALLCERMGGIDVWEVIEAAGTKPFGFQKFTPGPGVGGHCIPVDPYYLSWLAREHDFETRFITLAANINESMPYHVAHQVTKVIARQPIAISDARILVLGASFKKNVKDIRNSVSESVILRLREQGVRHIEVADPWVDTFPVGEETFHMVELNPQRIADYDCVLLLTDHDAFDIDQIVTHARHLIDTRNVVKPAHKQRENVTVLGVAAPRQRVVTSTH